MAELKACPFCGPDGKIGIYTEDTSKGILWRVECRTCGAHSGRRATNTGAIEAWNCREAKQEPLITEQSLEAIIEIAHKRGWNGVENGKILEEFIETEFAGLDRHIKVLKDGCARQGRRREANQAVPVDLPKLKNCPNCRSTDALNCCAAEDGKWMVRCGQCGLFESGWRTQESAIVAWNAAAPGVTLVEQCAMLRKRIAELERQAAEPSEAWEESFAREMARAAVLESELKSAKDLIYRLALKVM